MFLIVVKIWEPTVPPWSPCLLIVTNYEGYLMTYYQYYYQELSAPWGGREAPWGGPWGSQIFTNTQKCLRETLETVGSHFHKSYVTNNASTTSSVNLRTKAP